MNAAKLLAHFEKVSDAPDAMPRLRSFILDLAVRGKLVPQDSNDESASQVINRISSEKVRLAKVGNFKLVPPLPSIDKNDFPMREPAGWMLSRLGTISRRIHYGFTASADPTITDVRMLRITDIQDNSVDWHSVPGCLIDKDNIDQYKLDQGDILIARTGGTIGKTFLVRDVPVTAVFASYLIRVQGTPHVFDQYLKLFLESPLYWSQLRDGTRGTGQPNVNGQTLGMLIVPLAPIAEQRRIVAKVDELMALCDRLEAARTEREQRRDRLTAGSFARLKVPDPESLKDDARFALDILPALTTRSGQVKDLREVILNLAVRGKLVSQNSKDEPASELLKAIAEEIPAAKIAAAKSEPPPFELPRSWVWSHLGRLVSQSDAGWSPKTEDYPRSGDEWGVLKVSAVSWDTFRAWENKQVLPGTKPRPQAQVKLRDFLISRANTAELIARAVIVEEEPFQLMMSDKIVRLRLSVNCDHRFVWIVNNYADFAREHYVRHASGVSPSMKNVSRDVILSLPFPLPPLSEQHRIVAKVNELMTLCDRLEASLRTGEERRSGLLAAILNEALLPVGERDEAA